MVYLQGPFGFHSVCEADNSAHRNPDGPCLCSLEPLRLTITWSKTVHGIEIGTQALKVSSYPIR